ncbi:unnamed protein product [Prorocentrum cordatum]|uniref:Mei2-like C-terminal RNA recognition motif domain-containing protein n=1 Tax=Prorocentrum cordatum TaxID=2364126 RepID=A0ABN9SKY2_9DINO|nr:unnamed protein product [Polarella glacialis]
MLWQPKEATTEVLGEAQGKADAVPATDPEAKIYSKATLLRVFEQSGEVRRCQPTPPTTAGAATSSEPPSPRPESDEPREERGTFPVLAPASRAGRSAASRGAQAARIGGPQAQAAAMAQAQAMAMVDPASAPTTVMLRNIPSQFTRKLLQSALKDKGFANAYDFLYLPIDHSSGRSMGYAFINFRTQAWCGMFAEAFNGVPVNQCLSGFRANSRAAASGGKVFDVRIAQVQGFEANFARVSAGRHVGEKEEWRPIFLGPDGSRIPLQASPPQAHGNGSAAMWPDPYSFLQQQAFDEAYFPTDWAATFGAWAEQAFEEDAPAPWENAHGGAGAAGHGASMRMEACEFVPGMEAPVIERIVDGVPIVAAESHLKAKELAEMQAKARAQPPSGKDRGPGGDLPGSGSKEARLQQQIEYYFSVNNVCHDMHLRALMDRFGWVRLEALCEFPRLRSLGATAATAAEALRTSETVELSSDAHRARIRNVTLREAFPKVVDPVARIGPPVAAAEAAAAAAARGGTTQAAGLGGAT